MRHTRTHVVEFVEKLETSCTVVRNIKWCSHSGKTVGQFLKMLNVKLPHHPAVLLLGIYPKGMNTDVHSKTWMQLFIAPSFIVARNENNLPTHQQVNT